MLHSNIRIKRILKHLIVDEAVEATISLFIPNTAVFGPTNFIGTTIASTARMKISDEDFGWRFRLKISTVAGRGH